MAVAAGAESKRAAPALPARRSHEVQAAFVTIAAFIRDLYPDASDCSISFKTAAGPGAMPVDLGAVRDTVGADGLNDTQRGIMAILRASDEPMKRITVAHEMDRQDATGKFGTDFRQLVTGKGLPGNKPMIFGFGPHYTDDPKKFKADG